jgi:hypothetical protein
MTTFLAADLGSDSDPEDVDFRPESPKKRKVAGKRKNVSGQASDSDSGSSDSGDEEETATFEKVEGEDVGERQRKAEEALRALREEVTVKDDKLGEGATGEEELVEVRRARRFAGETI